MHHINRELIYDLGMNNGADTDFYLHKGFRVVAVEANVDLCRTASLKFRSKIKSGEFKILNLGIADVVGRRDFRINLDKDDWSSFERSYSDRTPNVRVVQVDCLRLDDLFDKFGIPYYLKVDIEGHDDCAVRALERQRELPVYVSTEATVPRFGERMASLGYDSFKYVSQRWAYLQPLPNPAKEGNFYDVKMTGFHSGPFGEETYGEWLTLHEFQSEIRKREAKDFENSLHKKWGCPEAMFYTWADYHARHSSQRELLGQRLSIR
jgi:FkbM family methyltransferase